MSSSLRIAIGRGLLGLGLSLALGLGAESWADEVPIPPKLRSALGRRSGALALQLADQALEQHPNAAAAWAWKGAALTVASRPVEAVEAFESGDGSEWYLTAGIRFHAESLRTIGRGHEAAELRAEGRGSIDLEGPTALSLEINILEDLIAMNDFDAAIEQAELVEMVAARPTRAHSVIADLYRVMGNDDEMLWHLFLAERNGNSHYRAAMVRMEVALSDGRIEDAWDYSEVVRKNHIRLPEFWAQKATLLDMIGSPAMGLHRLSTRRYLGHVHPDLMLAETRCHLAMGDLAEATQLADRMAQQFPELPQTEHAFQALAAGPWTDDSNSRP